MTPSENKFHPGQLCLSKRIWDSNGCRRINTLGTEGPFLCMYIKRNYFAADDTSYYDVLLYGDRIVTAHSYELSIYDPTNTGHLEHV
jgi:hypothetical protein